MLILQVVVLALLVLTLAAVVRRIPASHDHGPGRPRGPAAGDEPRRITPRLVAHDDAGSVHDAVRPLLRQIAIAGLARRGTSLDGDPDLAVAALGPELRAFLDPGRPAPVDRRGPGLDLATLESYVDRLEAL